MVDLIKINLIIALIFIIFAGTSAVFYEQMNEQFGTKISEENIVPFFVIIAGLGFLLMALASKLEIYKLQDKCNL